MWGWFAVENSFVFELNFTPALDRMRIIVKDKIYEQYSSEQLAVT